MSTTRLLDQIGPVGQFSEKRKSRKNGKSRMWYQMAPNGYKWFQMASNGSTWLLHMYPNGPIWIQMTLNSSKWLQMAPSGSKWGQFFTWTLWIVN